MNRMISLALLIAGIVLLCYGATAAESIGSAFSRLFAGKPTDKAILLLTGGIVLAIIGAAGLLRSSKA